MAEPQKKYQVGDFFRQVAICFTINLKTQMKLPFTVVVEKSRYVAAYEDNRNTNQWDGGLIQEDVVPVIFPDGDAWCDVDSDEDIDDGQIDHGENTGGNKSCPVSVIEAVGWIHTKISPHFPGGTVNNRVPVVSFCLQDLWYVYSNG